MNLNELLATVDQLAEDGLILPEETCEALKDKIDAYYAATKSLEAIADSLDEEEKRIYARKKNVQNNIKRMREYLLFNMKHFGWSEIKGSVHKAKIVRTEKFLVKADPDKYVGTELVIAETSYKFDKDKLKSLCEADPEKYKDICEFQQGESVRLT